MVWRTNLPKPWIKKKFMIPPPVLVCVEVNPGPSLLEDQRKDIVRWKKDGLSNKAIARKLKIDVRTVRTWVQRGLKRSSKKPSFKNRPGQGPKRKLTSKQEREVAKKAKFNQDAPQIARKLSQRIEDGVGTRTIQRTLRKQGLKYLVRQTRELITSQQAKNRLQFAQNRLNYDWEYAVFTDEKTFQVGGSKHKSWQDPDDRPVGKLKRHSAKIHVWGGIGLHFKTQLFFFQENLNAKLYCKILKDRLPPAYAFDLRPHDRHKWVLVQDNDPKHKSATGKEVLDELAPDRIPDWPSNSPDFNPIEDVWSTLDSELQLKEPKSIGALKSILRKSWNNLDMSKIRTSIESIPRRLEECIELDGERTSY